MIEATVTKGEFAEMIGVSPGRISQMIKAGKIGAASLDGEGRAARINVEKARADLRRTLDPSQSHGLNGMSTLAAISSQKPAPAAKPGNAVDVSPAPASASAQTLPVDNTAERIGREKLRQAEIATRRMEREEALDEGRFVLADEARAAIASAASKVLSTFESGLADMADAIAAAHGIPPRDALHTLSKSFREIRETASQTFAGQREAILEMEAEALKRVAEETEDDTEE